MTPKPRRVLLYHDFIREEAALINADGCTGVTNVNGWACLEHDLAYYHGKRPTHAYRKYCAGVEDFWGDAEPTTFEEANANFKRALFRESVFGHLNPLSWVRYAAMRLKKTRSAWDEHRQRERDALGVGA